MLNNRFLTIGLFLLLCLTASESYADLSLSSCSAGQGFIPESIAAPIVYCLETTIRTAVIQGMNTMSNFLQGTVSAVMLLAVVMHGAKVASGERDFSGKSVAFMLRVAFVWYFSFNLGGFATLAFDVMKDLLAFTVGGYSPWETIDKFLGTLFGFAPGIALFQGLIWLGTGLVSGTASFGMGSGLIVALIEFIMLIIEIIYTYILSFTVVGFMLILSPMFIPTLMFRSTERYFRKWLDTILGAMLVPVFLFAFLSMSLGLYSSVLKDIFKIILPDYNLTIPTDSNNPPDFTAFFRKDIPAISMGFGSDPNYLNALNKGINKTSRDAKNIPSVHTTVNPLNNGSSEISIIPNPPGIDFGSRNQKTNQKLIFAFVTLWLYTAVMKQLIRKMPEVAQEVAGSATGISLEMPSLKDKIAEVKENLVSGAGALAGGIGGAQVTGAFSKNANVREAGAIGGGVLGSMLARKAL